MTAGIGRGAFSQMPISLSLIWRLAVGGALTVVGLPSLVSKTSGGGVQHAWAPIFTSRARGITSGGGGGRMGGFFPWQELLGHRDKEKKLEKNQEHISDITEVQL